MCGDQWPTLLYSGTYDPMDPRNGLLHNNILFKVSNLVNIYQLLDSPQPSGIQVHFHIAQFSQCGGQGNPIRQCLYPWYGMCNTWVNCIHCYSGNLYMCVCVCVLIATNDQLYYVLKVWFALSSSLVFSHTDKICDSKWFYNSLLELLYNADEQKEVEELLIWWNWWVVVELYFLYALMVR